MKKTQDTIRRDIKEKSLNVPVVFNDFDDWEDFLILSREINVDDLLLIISSRKGSVSYINMLDNIPLKLEKHFPNNNKVIIYPQQFNQVI